MKETLRQIVVLYPDSVSYQYFLQLFEQSSKAGKGIHDLEIAAIALSNDVTTIATVNKKDFIKVKGLNILAID
jgi:predicted nucleic acid-binding protein